MIGGTAGIVPSDKDVLSGHRSWSHVYERHPGNKRFRERIKEQQKLYQRMVSRRAKSSIIHEIVRSFQVVGGRFLQFDETASVWSVLSHRRVTDKIGHALRCGKRANRKKLNAQKRTIGQDSLSTSSRPRPFGRYREVCDADDSTDARNSKTIAAPLPSIPMLPEAIGSDMKLPSVEQDDESVGDALCLINSKTGTALETSNDSINDWYCDSTLALALSPQLEDNVHDFTEGYRAVRDELLGSTIDDDLEALLHIEMEMAKF